MTLVLLVEDDTNLLRALEMLVSDDGYRVKIATDGIEAMDAVTQERPDLVVTDVMMPRMDGLQLVRALKAVPTLADIPVVMTSAVTIPSSIPIHSFLPKPFSAAQLLNILHDLKSP